MALEIRGRVRSMAWWGGLAALALIVSASPAGATNYYADGSCSFDGNGRANQCATSAGAAGARNSGSGLQALINTATCGDTVTVKAFNGAYWNTPQGLSNYESGAFYINGKSCAQASPFVLKGADRNNKPKFCTQSNCAYVDTPTIQIHNSAYVTIDGIYVDGALAVYNPGRADHIEIAYSEFVGGMMCDGNFNTLYLSDTTYAWVHNNYFHDLNADSTCGQSHRAFAKTFRTQHDTWEYNTMKRGGGDHLKWAVDMKDSPYFDVWRYNYFEAGVAINRQNGSSRQPQGVEVYGNVFTGGVGSDAQGVEVYGDMSSVYVHHNTFGDGILCIGDSGWGPVTSSQFRDNIVNRTAGCEILSGGGNAELSPLAWSYRSNYDWNHNVYNASGSYRAGGSTYSDVASWRSAFGSGKEAGSIETTCAFTNPTLPNDDWHITGGTCKTASSTGGELGAYGVTSCVGYLCGASAPVCGNNVKESGETCDGTDLGGETCVSQGFGGGSLACNANCQSFVTSACTGDVTPPVRSNGEPSGALPSGTTQTTLSLVTNENATCKYSTTAGVSYSSMTGTFATTGGTSHSTTVAGLQDGQSYTYYVRCRDAASNANPDDYPIGFSVSAASQAGGLECTNWQTNHPTWIWCDDLESDSQLTNDYFDVDRQSGTLAVASDQYYGGTHSLKFHYAQGTESVGWIWRSFGRNPIQQKSDPTTDFQEVYWRFYVRHQSPWTVNTSAGGDKYTRATMFVASDWSQGMIAHIWNNSSSGLQQSPVRCSSGTGTVCTGYNDFAHMIYEGDVNGTHTVTAPSDVGQWHCVEGHVKLNTPGSADGVFQTWIDGTLDINDSTINWRDRYTGYGINAISLEGVWNGGAPTTQDRWMDNFVISRDRIGCNASAPTGPSTPTNLHRTDTH